LLFKTVELFPDLWVVCFLMETRVGILYHLRHEAHLQSDIHLISGTFKHVEQIDSSNIPLL